MKKLGIIILLIGLLLAQTLAVSALTADEAKNAWRDTKENSAEMGEFYREAKIDFAKDNSEENKEEVMFAGIDVLHAALDEAEAWLEWKGIEALESEIPEKLKQDIRDDVNTNLGKVDALREEVDAVENRAQLGIVFLRMIGKYAELLTDVARNSGKVWVHVTSEKADTVEEYEARLRETADGEALAKLDLAKEELEKARKNIEDAERVYDKIVVGGTPLRKFAEGNNYLRNARLNLINANKYLREAFRLIVGGTE